MVLSNDDKSVIKACYLEKGWRGKRICKEFPSRNFNVRTVNHLIKRIEVTGSASRQKGSGRPVTVRTPDNIDAVEELALSQDDALGTHIFQRQITNVTKISKTSVQRIISHDLKLKSIKQIHLQQISHGSKQRKVTRSRMLLEDYNTEDLKRMCFQDEKDFSLQIPTNRQNDRLYITGLKRDVNPERLFHRSNTFSLKLMVSCVISHNGISRPFFVNPQLTKVNADLYVQHLEDDLLPECYRLYPDGNFIFVQDGAPSHRAKKTQNFLRRELGDNFVDKLHWPPYSPDCSPLDYYFWNELQNKVFEGQREPFIDIDSLRERIITVWNKVAKLTSLRKAIRQFLLRLNTVVTNNGGSIKNRFG